MLSEAEKQKLLARLSFLSVEVGVILLSNMQARSPEILADNNRRLAGLMDELISVENVVNGIEHSSTEMTSAPIVMNAPNAEEIPELELSTISFGLMPPEPW